MLEVLKVEAKKAARIVAEHDYIRIFSHYDADGISAASIMATALLRKNKQFHITYLKGLLETPEIDDEGLVIFQDMGSGQPDIISEIDADVVIADHHYPSGKIRPFKDKNLAHVNPHLAGMDGTYELSASGVAYVVANQIGDNSDLSSIAMVGMLGDKQKITGGNAEIVKEGIKTAHISEGEGLNIYSGRVSDVLTLSTEPYLDFYDNEEELDEFLKEIKIDREAEIDDLKKEEVSRLANAIVLRILKMGGFEGVVEDFVGKKYTLNNELLTNAVMLSEVVNSCGRASAMGIGLAICLRDSEQLERGMELWKKFQFELLDEIKKRKLEAKEGDSIRYIIIENGSTTSPIATVLSRYIFSDKPLIVLNVKKEMVKISARSNVRISKKINLADVMRDAAKKVNGRGGGHSVAAGANISPENVDEFIKEVDRLCSQQN